MHRTCPLSGLKQTRPFADVRFLGRYWGVKRTCRFALQMSAFHPKRTSICFYAPEYGALRASAADGVREVKSAVPLIGTG